MNSIQDQLANYKRQNADLASALGMGALARTAMSQQGGDMLWVDSASQQVYKKQPYTLPLKFDGTTDDGKVRMVYDLPAGVEFLFEPGNIVEIVFKVERLHPHGYIERCGGYGKAVVEIWDCFERELRGKIADGYINYGMKATVAAPHRAVSGDKLIVVVDCEDFKKDDLKIRVSIGCQALVRVRGP